MIELEVPGWKTLRIERVISDFNGTLATDGVLEEGVADRLRALGGQVEVVVLTADTHGTAAETFRGLPVRLEKIEPGREAEQKKKRVQQAGAATTAFLGNGANDREAMSAAAVSVAVIGHEGAFMPTLAGAQMIAATPADALDLLLKPKRLVAGLRR